MAGHIAAIPKQTYDLDRSNRFLVGKLPGNRLRGSYAEGASYCWRFGRLLPIDWYLVNFVSRVFARSQSYRRGDRFWEILRG